MTYLTIITTVLVLTQIIRVTQNAMSLRRFREVDKHNDGVLEIWRRMDRRG